MSEIVIKAKYDQITGVCKYFTLGTIESDISGGLYIKKDVPIPKRIVIEIKEGE